MAEKPDREEDDKWVQLIGLEPKDKDKDKKYKHKYNWVHFIGLLKQGNQLDHVLLLAHWLSTSAACQKLRKLFQQLFF